VDEAAGVASLPEDLTLHEAADQLGLHYMTVYRYVRTGRLPARRVASEWRVDAADVATLAEAPAHVVSPVGRVGAGRPRRVDHVDRLIATLVTGDEAGVWAVVQSALAGGLEPEALYVRVMAPAMTEIGERWSRGELTVAQEHLASAVLSRVIGRLGPLFTRRGRTRGTVVLGAAPGDDHALPSALFADLLRGRGLAVVHLGANTPAASFVEAASGADRLVGVGVSVTLSDNTAAVAEVVARLHRAAIEPIVVGGGGIDELAVTDLGADHWAADAEGGLVLFDELAVRAGRDRRRTRAAER